MRQTFVPAAYRFADRTFIFLYFCLSLAGRFQPSDYQQIRGLSILGNKTLCFLCLTFQNVYSPLPPQDGSLFPVQIWIHGIIPTFFDAHLITMQAALTRKFVHEQ